MYALLAFSGKRKKLFLSTPRKHVGGVELQLHSFLTSVLVGGERSTLRSCPFTPEKKFRYAVNSNVGGPCSQSGRTGEETSLLPVPKFEPGTVEPVT